MSETKPKHRWLRYSLRSVMVLTFLFGVAFALIARHAHQRKAALAAVRDNGGQIQFDPKYEPKWPESLLGKLFGPETYQPVRSVNMLPGRFITEESRKILPDDFLAKLSALPEIQDLDLENMAIAANDWQNIARFPHVFNLLLNSSNISDDGIRALSLLPELEELGLNDLDGITNASMVWLSRSPKLGNLNIRSCNLTDEGLRNFRPVGPLIGLLASSNNITSAGVESLTKIQGLKSLMLSHTKIDDKALDDLAALPNLKTLEIVATQVTPKAVQHFRDTHPQCNVHGPH